MAITPGPNNTMLLASGLNHGVRRSLPHWVGVNLGFGLMVIILGFGLGSIFQAAPALHQVIRFGGVLYLCYLAWLIASTPTKENDPRSAKPLSLWQAGLFQWVNPKAWVMITGAIATYTTPGLNIYVQVLLLTVIFLVVGSPCGVVWLVGGAGLKRVMKNPRHHRMFNVSMALLLVSSLYPVVKGLLVP